MVSAKQVLELLLHPNELRAVLNYKIWHEPLRNLEDDVETSRYDQPTMRRCWELLDHSSRSFVVVIKELEAELGRVICIFYLVLRALDTLEDDMTLDINLKEKMLNELYLKLEDSEWNFTGSGPNEKDRNTLIEFQTIRHEFSLLDEGYRVAIQDIARMMGKGMAKFARIAAENPSTDYQVGNLEDFDLYCHYVAGVVGEGLSRLFAASGRENPDLPRYITLSNSMGLLLQKVNVMRDFAEDLRDGRLFWPKAIWGKYVNDPKEFWDDSIPDIEKKRLWALNEMCFDALRHSLDSLNYLSMLKRQSIFNFCAIPQVMGIATIAECWGNPDVFKKNVKIRKGVAVQIITQTTNPRAAAYLFKEYADQIHRKTPASDPLFLKVSVLCGKIAQWSETKYPSYVPLRGGQPTQLDIRMKGIPEAIMLERKKKMDQAQQKISWEDTKFIILVVAAIATFLTVVGGGIFYALWHFCLREGAPYAHIFETNLTTPIPTTSAKTEL